MNETVENKKSVITWLFNPFTYLAGGWSLLIGLIGIGVIGLIGAFSRTHFDGVLDVHSGIWRPLWFFLAEGYIDWISLAVPLYLVGKVLSKSRIRAVDVFGTQALARLPTLITVLLTLLPAYQRMTAAVASGGVTSFDALRSEPLALAAVVVAMIGIILVLIWTVALMYKAYAVSCNIKGGRAIGSFIVVVLLAEITSKVLIIMLLK